MLGQVEVALRRDRSPEEYRDVLRRVNGQASQLRQIVEMLLFLARADADARLPQLEPLDLAAWLPEHLQQWSTHTRYADIRLEGAAAGPLPVRASAPLLGQLVDNLLDNACKYSEPETPIAVGVREEKDTILVSVADVGCGIDANDLPHLFEPFYRAPAARRRGVGGVGLGLAVARRIAVASGGQLNAESDGKRGTQLTLRLPKSEASSPHEQNGKSPEPCVAQAGLTSRGA
jgi:signal transduction histidine kinase